MSGTISISLTLTSSPSSPRVNLSIPTDVTASALHELVANETSIPIAQIKIIFRGRLMPKTSQQNAVSAFSLEDGCVVHIMGKPSAAGAAQGTTSSTNAEASSSGASNTTSLGATASVVSPPPTSSTSTAGTSASVTSSPAAATEHPLKVALNTMKTNHDASTYATGVATLVKLLDNIMKHPMEEKYRKVKKGNAAFNKRLGRLTGAYDAIESIGFTLQSGTEGGDGATEIYELVASAEAWPQLVECKSILDNANTEAQRISTVGGGSGIGFTSGGPTPGMNTPMGTAATGGMGGMPSPMFPPVGGMGGMGGMGPGAEQAMSSMLQNPEQLRAMLDNPMVQQMMESDPRIANNPMARQSLDMLRRNPQMLEQASRMMSSNPEMMRNMMNNANLGGAGGGIGSTPTPTPAGGAPDMDAMRRAMEMMQSMNNMGGAGAGAGGSNTPGMPPQQQTQQNQGSGTGANNSNSGNTSGNNNGGDTEMTEEEMIAEAIARSLRES